MDPFHHLAVKHPPVLLPDTLRVCRPDQVQVGLADDLGRGPAKETLHGGIDLGIPERPVLDEDGILGGGKDGPEARFALLQGLLGVFSVRNVYGQNRQPGHLPVGIQDGIDVNIEMKIVPGVFKADGAPGGDGLLKERPAPGGHLRGE